MRALDSCAFKHLYSEGIGFHRTTAFLRQHMMGNPPGYFETAVAPAGNVLASSTIGMQTPATRTHKKYGRKIPGAEASAALLSLNVAS
ncbi:MAG: hypothetical protein R6X19_08990 [Kiritimatiellia bacterium]